MHERPFDPLSVEQPYRSIVGQLSATFSECAVRLRYENFGDWLSIALVDKASGNSLTIPLVYAGGRRTWKFHEVELDAFRRRLKQLA